MDILRPDLLWIEGRCYRINAHLSSDVENEEPYEEEFVIENSEAFLEESLNEIEIETTENGRFKVSLSVPRFYFPFVIGTKGAVRHRLEIETKTQIRVPRQGQNGLIVVTGDTKEGVLTASRRLDLIVMSARQRQQFTHFLSIPMTGDSIMKRFLNFKEEVLDVCENSRGVDSSIFQDPKKLHLTLGTMVLMNEDEREKCSQALTECNDVIINSLLQNKMLIVQMVGVEYMNDDPAEVDVLYGKVRVKDGSELLQELANGVTDYFISKGFMKRQYEQVKLHVTLMNTLFRTGEFGETESEISRRKSPRESFDATTILKNFVDYDFGEQIVNTIHLSLRHSKSTSGYYQATSEIHLL